MKFCTPLLFALLWSASINAQNATVLPTIADNPTWNVMNALNGGTWPPSYSPFEVTYGDSVALNGKSYVEVLSGWNSNDTLGWFREDSNKVFWQGANAWDEYLLYDFDATPGQHLVVGLNLDNWGVENTIFRVDSVDSLNVMGVIRKALYMSYDESPAEIAYPHWSIPDSFDYNLSDYNLHRNDIWIEGIGSTIHPFYSAIACFNAGGGCEQDFFVLCADTNGTQIYDRYGWTCSGVFWLGDEEQLIDNSLSAYPVPFQNQLTIDVPAQNGPFSLKMYDPLGRLVFEDPQFISGPLFLHRLNLAPGPYFITLDAENRRYQTHVLKE